MAPAGSATLGKNVTVKGQIFSREDLTIDGEVEGTVECHEHRLTIGPNGRVHAGLKAREIVIYGSIQGNVEATDKIDIKKEAKLVGDIKTSRIMIEDGAYFKGSIDIAKAAAQPRSARRTRPQTLPVRVRPGCAAARCLDNQYRQQITNDQADEAVLLIRFDPATVKLFVEGSFS